MKKERYEFASECVTMGHPDKIADQISDGILDEILRCDKNSRVACETLVTKGLVFVAGEITTECWVDINMIIRRIVDEIGYNEEIDDGFEAKALAIINTIHEQSPDIAQGVNRGNVEDLGAGDQGMMFGYACDETPSLMPMPISLARGLCNRLAKVRQDKIVNWLRPDGKSQVTVEYENGKPIRVREVLISTMHADWASNAEIRELVAEEIVKKVIPAEMLVGFDFNRQLLVNPTGRFVKGGPGADTGLTGRKIIVDTYGGMGRHGGGCFSGKDPSKVDRSGAYIARYIAKNIVAAKLATRCEIELSYAIGIPEPRSIFVDTFGTATVPEQKIAAAVREIFPLSVGKIIKHFDLQRPLYLKTARWGHFGLSDHPWEATDMVSDLLSFVNK